MNETNIPPLTPAPTGEKAEQLFVENPFKKDENIDLEQAREELEKDLVTSLTEVEEEEPIIAVDEKYGVFTKKNIHLVKAKAKGGKTTMLKAVVAAILCGAFLRLKSLLSNPKIVWFDTEQSSKDTKRIILDIIKWGNLSQDNVDLHLKVYHLRRYFFDELRVKLVTALVVHKPDAIILDGVVDMVNSFNDEVETRHFVRTLMKLSEDYNCAIINVLHTNKSLDDHNPRGHLGSNSVNASDTVLECEKLGNIFRVKSTESRHASMPAWHYKYEDDGNIVGCDELKSLFEKKDAAKIENRAKRVETMLDIIKSSDGRIKRSDLVKQMEDKGIGRTAAYTLINAELNISIVDEGVYILMKEDSAS